MFLPSGSLRSLLPFSWPRSHSVNAFPISPAWGLLWVNTLPSALPSLCAPHTASFSAPGPLHTPFLLPRELSLSSYIRPTSYSSECGSASSQTHGALSCRLGLSPVGPTLWFCLWTFKPHWGVGTPSSPWPPTWELSGLQHRPGMRVPGRAGYL